MARADSVTSALINRQLDSRQDLDLSGTLPQAIEMIEKKTGVHCEVDPEVWDTLPWGRDTTVAATVRNAPLRDALSAITSKLGLGYRLTDRAVQMSLLPPLDRLNRRAELPELDVLALLQQTPLPPALARQTGVTVAQLCDAVDRELAGHKSAFAIEDRASDTARAKSIDLPRNATLYDALEAIGRQSTATWYPGGKTLFVVAKQDVYRRKLGGRVTARYDGVDVPQVLLELFQREAIPFEVEPGVYAGLPAQRRLVRLMLQDTSLREALQTVSGETGLKFEVTDRGIYVSGPAAASTRPTTIATTTPMTAPTTRPTTTKPVISK